MFLQKTMDRNRALIDVSKQLAHTGKIRPDTYVIDLDSLLSNAKKMLKEAQDYNVKLFFMLKQLGRNPYVAKELIDLGYEGAVVVDYKEAEIMMDHQIPIAHAGHLVQVPNYLMNEIVAYGVGTITVFSIENARQINQAAKKGNRIQNIMIRVVDEGDNIYSGQTAGIYLAELLQFAKEIGKLSHIRLNGLTVFPAMLFNEESDTFEKTPNLETLLKAQKMLEEAEIVIDELNIPSATCIETIAKIAKYGGTSGEPGHGFTGTTPAHALLDLTEKPSVVYVSEVSHHFKNKSYFYGGGYYRRGHFENALVDDELKGERLVTINPPDVESIDYYFEIDQEVPIGSPVIGAFRYQIFVTRSDVALVEGIQSQSPKIVGIFDSLGKELHRHDRYHG